MENQKQKMENQKRKLQVNGGEGRRTKSREDNGEKTATEAEVEEFFAILKQLHSAVRQLRKDDGGDDVVVLGVGGRSKLKEDQNQNQNNINKGSSWKPVFEWADFEETTNKSRRIIKDTAERENGDHHHHQHQAQDKKEGVEENLVGFDLNAEPESET